MALKDLFKTSTPQKQTDNDPYYLKMFPLGDEQREVEKTMLNELIHTRISSEEKLFCLLVAREALSQQDDEKQTEQLVRWYHNDLFKNLSDQQRGIILAMAQLNMSAGTLEQLAGAAEIQQQGKLLEQNLLPALASQKPKREKGLFSIRNR